MSTEKIQDFFKSVFVITYLIMLLSCVVFIWGSFKSDFIIKTMGTEIVLLLLFRVLAGKD